ncbi:MAG: aminofutalosine synthase MqnE, partial [bacterium]
VDLLTLGQLANQKREALHGYKTYYVKNLHIDYSNICILQCKFCAYSRKQSEPGAFELSVDDILSQIRKHANEITQVHIVGGHHPKLTYDYYTGLLKSIHQEFPDLHIKAFTAIEINYFAQKFGKTVNEVLSDFKACGLSSLPGGGAEILVDDVREKICMPKGPSQIWLDVHKQAHELGLSSTATMLFGHVESLENRIEHMEKIRALQDETQGFKSFVPLVFHPQNTVFEDIIPPTAHEILKTIAVSRLYLDNIPHIKAYWVMMGLSLAQIALHFGADDVHGTVIQENISHMAGAKSPQGVSVERLESFIKTTGRMPIQ